MNCMRLNICYSQGRVYINSSSVFDAVVIDPQYFSHFAGESISSLEEYQPDSPHLIIRRYLDARGRQACAKARTDGSTRHLTE